LALTLERPGYPAGDATDLTDWSGVDALDDNALEALVAGDPDEGGDLSEVDLAGVDGGDWREVVATAAARKTMVNMRLDKDVLAFFRDGGRGYQTRINAVLRAYMEAHRKGR
jgi:hypothetical protein